MAIKFSQLVGILLQFVFVFLCLSAACVFNVNFVNLQALGWQRLACRVAMERCGASGPWLRERITLCRYAHVCKINEFWR